MFDLESLEVILTNAWDSTVVTKFKLEEKHLPEVSGPAHLLGDQKSSYDFQGRPVNQ